MAATNVEVWQRGEIIEIVDIAHDIKRIVIRQSSTATADPGSHVDVMITVDDELVRRSYSIVEQSADRRDLTLGVFLVPNSRGGSIAMHKLSVGDQLDITQPLLNFPLRVGADKYVLVAGGIGITALVAMADVLKRIGADYTLMYAARSKEAMAFRVGLEKLHGERLQLFCDDENSFIDIPELVARLTGDTELYMCGPIRLMDAIRREWVDSNMEYTNLRYETFGVSGWFDPEEFIVRIPAKGVEVVVGQQHSMLEALESAGVDMLSDCRKGECGLCEVRVTSLTGRIDHRDVFYSEHEKNANYKISCCVSRIVTSETGLNEHADVMAGPAIVEIVTT
jgi:vanillate O-demethylase ferredoxin subunit